MNFFRAMSNLLDPRPKVYVVIGKDKSLTSDLTWISEIFECKEDAQRFMHGKIVKYMDLCTEMGIIRHIPPEEALKFYYSFCNKVDFRAKPFSEHGIMYEVIEWEAK